MALCRSQKYVGRDVIVEYAIGCGDQFPNEDDWSPLGALRANEFTLEWETTDATAADSIGSLRENIATFQTLAVSGDGACKLSGVGAAELLELTKHVAKPEATGGQPLAWVRFTFPDLTFIALMVISNLSRSAPHDDLVTYSFAASATSSDYGLVVEDTPSGEGLLPASIALVPQTLTLMIGRQYTLQAAVLPAGASQAVRFSSSDSDTAKVGLVSGTVSGVAAGTATITAKSAVSDGVTTTSTITVKPVITGISGQSASVSIQKSSTEQLTPSPVPGNAPDEFVYSSNNTAVATVNSSGLISGVDVGTTTIRITSPHRPTIYLDVSVTVTPN